jgi:hypothetical protein
MNGTCITIGDLKGTWIAAMKVKDAAIWKRIESDEIIGFSMGGTKEFV